MSFIEQFAKIEPNQKGKLGIDNCKSLILYVADAMPKLKEVLADSKISFWEALGISPLLIQGTRLLANFKAVVLEIQDLTLDETQQLITELKEVGAFRSNTYADVENRLRHFVDFVNGLICTYLAAEAFYKNSPHADSQKFG